jgi:hypothetical protein
MDGAEPAFDAFVLFYFEGEDIPSRREPQEGAQGTDIPAPESFSAHIEKHDTQKNCSDEKALDKSGVDV